MTVCEVEVFGLKKDAPELTPPEINRALNGTTWQISTYSTFVSHGAVDGGYEPNYNQGQCQVSKIALSKNLQKHESVSFAISLTHFQNNI